MVMQKTSMAALIKRYRKMKRLTQDDVANVFGWSRSFVQRLEKGTRFPDPDVLIPLIQYLNIPLSEIYVAYDRMPDSDFESAKMSRELAKSIIASTFKSESESILNGAAKGMIPPYLQKTIDSADLGGERDVMIDALEEYLYGQDHMAKYNLKRLFDHTDTYSIKEFMENIFSGLSIIETGTLSRRTQENRVLVEMAARFAAGATASSQSHSDWNGTYQSGYFISALREIVRRLEISTQRAQDASKVNLELPNYLKNMKISPKTFDYMHFVFHDYIPQDTGRSMSAFQDTINSLDRFSNVSDAIDFPRIYRAFVDVWPLIYDLRDTYAALHELQALQPEESYPDPTPDVLEVIRSTVKMADNSWRL